MTAGKHSATGVLATRRNDRHAHLDALRAGVEARQELACEVVVRRGVAWVSVIGPSQARVEVGCDYVRSGWWFTWADGRLFAPVRDVEGVIARLVGELGDA
ncbi:hypothetical protein [Actinomadura chokoriensis]|uniref:DUF3024 domain-containing protein n=1 Tax=Actinomadura chokoriensis TaxID=454156 RepID=A0ABV4QZT2_9ACTN